MVNYYAIRSSSIINSAATGMPCYRRQLRLLRLLLLLLLQSGRQILDCLISRLPCSGCTGKNPPAPPPLLRCHCYIQTIVLPRQARDKDGEKVKQKRVSVGGSVVLAAIQIGSCWRGSQRGRWRCCFTSRYRHPGQERSSSPQPCTQRRVSPRRIVLSVSRR